MTRKFIDGGGSISETTNLIYHNIECYYESNFKINYDEDEESLTIIHPVDNYFRVITSDDSIIDCVLGIRVEPSEKKVKVVYEIGLVEETSGFYSKLLDPEQKYVLYMMTYTPQEKKNFEYLM